MSVEAVASSPRGAAGAAAFREHLIGELSAGNRVPTECLDLLARLLDDPRLAAVDHSFHFRIQTTVERFLERQARGAASPRSFSLCIQRFIRVLAEEHPELSSLAKASIIYRRTTERLPPAERALIAATPMDLNRIVAVGRSLDAQEAAIDMTKIASALSEAGLPEEVWDEPDPLAQAARIRAWMGARLTEDPHAFDEINLLDMSSEELYSFKGFVGLSALINLWLNDNQIATFVGMPPMPRLEGLWMDGNLVASFHGMPDLPALDELSMDDNKVESFAEMPSFADLRMLSLSKNKIQTLEGMPVCPQLEEVYLDHNRISSFRGMPVLPSLAQLYMEANQLSSFEGLAAQPHLQELDVSENGMSSFVGMPALPELEILRMNHNKVRSFMGMSICPALEELYLAHNRIESFADMPVLSQLSHLWMQHNSVRSLAQLPHLPELQALYLSHNQITSLPRSLVDMPHLTTLSLYGNPILHVAPEILASDRAVFAENPVIEKFRIERDYAVIDPLGRLYSAILHNGSFADLQTLFTNLSIHDKHRIEEFVWREANGPDVPNWGHAHCFDNQDIFERAVRRCILAKLERLPLESKTAAYCRVATLSGVAPDPDYGEMHAFDNLTLLADALNVFEN
jgi:Leucine-rich repeat (LRR) protein